MSRGTLVPAASLSFSPTGLLPSLAVLSRTLRLTIVNSLCRPATPQTRRFTVWALPLSLAATQGIDVSLYSSGYLDVSVHRVPSCTLCIHVQVTRHYSGRVAPFGNPWFDACLRLSMAYRSLPRPSSAPDAKASTVRSFSLDCL